MPELKLNTSEEVEKLMKHMNDLWFNATEEQKKDADWVFSMLRHTFAPLVNLDEKLKKDRDFAMKIANSYPEYITILDESIWMDKQIMLKAVKFGYSMRSMPKEFLKDQEILDAYDNYTAKFVESRNAEKNDNLSRAKLI